MEKIYIAAARRTAIGRFNGSLAKTPAGALGAGVVRDILDSTGLPAGALAEVVVGNALPAGAGQGVARQVSLGAGVSQEVPASAVNMVCGSGMKAVLHCATAIKAGCGHLYMAGGSENMSMAPYLVPGARQGLRLGNSELVDHMVQDALTDAFSRQHMGITAENLAERYHISRQEQDDFAYASQQKALAAIGKGAFGEEIVPFRLQTRGETVTFDTDEYPNRASTPEKLASLKPAFQKDGTVTAGNASGINDGAAFVLLADGQAVAQYNLTPLAEIIAFGQGGVAPALMGLGPVPAIGNALAMAGCTLGDIDIFELNEAFAAQSLAVLIELAAKHSMAKEDILARTNLHGGAIALGHPVGASGARILVTLAHLMQKHKARRGLASLCIGGGMGTAVILQKV